jgi:hypothetical protein
LRRSCTTAWKKVMPKRSLCQSRGLAHESHCDSLSVAHVPLRLARMPLGGSNVILIEFWSTGTGK